MEADLIKKIRKKVESNLKTWIPENDNLVNKELALFDRLMTRRDFLKTTSLVTLSAILGHGCSSSHNNTTPSQWNGIDENFTLINYDDIASIQTPSKIIVDSDVLPSMVNYSPLRAIGSDDALEIKADAVMESFNPHLMTSETNDYFVQTSLKRPERTYGTPEYVHLCQDDASSDYYFSIYEKSHDGHHGLEEVKIDLAETSSLTFNHLVVANGSFHNKVSGSSAYSQKMILALNLNEHEYTLDSSVKVPLQLYYQTESSELLQPGVEPAYDLNWENLDLMSLFTQNESHTFTSYKIVDAQSYRDGANHSFIYGTIRFDEYYNYGFVITFNSITDTKPTVRFFAPEYLSVKSTLIEDLKTKYQNINSVSTHSFSDFGLFSNQTFEPLSQLVDTESKTSSEVVFSFVSYDSSVSIIDSPEFNKFIENSTVDIYKETFFKRYLVRVDTSSDGVSYAFADYLPTTDLTGNANSLTLTFDNTLIPSVDVWNDIYNQNIHELNHPFVRYIKNETTQFNILLATSYNDATDIGVSQKSINLSPTSSGDGFSSITISTSNSLFNDALFDDGTTTQNYKELWFNDMKVHLEDIDGLSVVDSLSAAVNRNGGSFDFFCTQNHQGLLRSYFEVRYINSDATESSFLIGFNEEGIAVDDESYEYQEYENLKGEITSNTTSHFPPMPITMDALEIYQWHAVISDAEVVYRSDTHSMIDETTRELVEYDGLAGDLHSYIHSSCDEIDKHWYMHEEQKRVSNDTIDYLVKSDLHQVHLHVSNIYDLPVTLDEDTFVEVKFSKKLIVKDVTDHTSPKTYHVNTHGSLFLKPDEEGRVTLEIDAGTQESQYQGATIEYRLVGASTLTHQEDTPVTYVSSVDGITSEFKEFNISFRMYERFSSENYDSQQVGGLATTPNDGYLEHLVGAEDSITQFGDAFSKLHNDSKPDNETTMTNLSVSYMAVSLSDGQTRLSSIPNKVVVFKSRRRKKRKKFRPFAWIKHVVKHVRKKVKKIATHVVTAVKTVAKKLAKTVDDVVADINTGLETLGSVIVEAAEDIAAAAEKVWDEIKSFAEKFWNWLKSLFDTSAAWDIGQEIKQLISDQLKPIGDSSSQNTHSNNLYSFLEGSEEFIKSEVSSITDYFKENIDDAIDGMFNQSNDVDSKMSDTKDKQNKSKEKSTSSNHLFDQIKRVIGSLSLDVVSCNIDTSEGSVSDLMSSTVSELGENTFAPIELLFNQSMQNVSKVFTGTSMTDMQSTFANDLKLMSNVIIDDIETVANSTAKLPLAILNDTSSCEIDVVVQARRTLLDMLGFLLFGDKNKFSDAKDFGAFLVGYHINIIEVLLLGPVKDANGNIVDVITHIKDGTLRDEINKAGGQFSFTPSSSASQSRVVGLIPAGEEPIWYRTLIAVEVIEFIAALIDRKNTLVSSKVDVIGNEDFITGVRATIKFAEFIIMMHASIKQYIESSSSTSSSNITGDDILLALNDRYIQLKLLMGVFLVLRIMLSFFVKYIKTNYKIVYGIIMLLAILQVLCHIIIVTNDKNQETNQTVINLFISITVFNNFTVLTNSVQKIIKDKMKREGLLLSANPYATSLAVFNALADLSLVGMKISINGIHLAEVT